MKKFKTITTLLKNHMKVEGLSNLTQDQLFDVLHQESIKIEDESTTEFLEYLLSNKILIDDVAMDDQGLDQLLELDSNAEVSLEDEEKINKLNHDSTQLNLSNKLTDETNIHQWYIRWVGKYGKLLTASEERELARKRDKGGLFGKKALDKLILHNLRLVINNAKKYKQKGLSFQDLISEGNVGLITAAKKFSWEKGFRFSTYATIWIKKEISRALATKGRVVRVPVHLVDHSIKLNKIEKELTQKNGTTPTDEELAKALGINKSAEFMSHLRKIHQQALSLDRTLTSDSTTTMVDMIDSGDKNPIDYAEAESLQNHLMMMLEDCVQNNRDKELMLMRYGIGEDDEGVHRRSHEVKELATKFNITEWRVRQIESQVMRKLKQHDKAETLKEYVVDN